MGETINVFYFGDTLFKIVSRNFDSELFWVCLEQGFSKGAEHAL